MKSLLMIDYHAIIKEAAIHLGTKPEYLKMYSWYEMFPSTAGPHFGRIAGQAFTEFQVLGFGDKLSGTYIKYCDGIWKDWNGDVEGSW